MGGRRERRIRRAHRHVVGPAQHFDRNDALVRRAGGLRGERRAVLRRLSRRHRPHPSDEGGGDRLAADRLAQGRRPAARPAAGGEARLVPEAHDPSHAARVRPRLVRRSRQRLSRPRARGRARLLFAQARRFHPGGDRPAGAGGTVRPHRRPARPRPAGGGEPGRARGSAGRPHGPLRGLRRALRSGDAQLGAGTAGQRRSSGRRPGTRRSSGRPNSPRRAAKSASTGCPTR